MILDTSQSRVGSGGTIPGNRQKMSRTINVALRTSSRWTASEGYIDPKVIGDFTCTPHEARLLARALVAEAKIVEAARR